VRFAVLLVMCTAEEPAEPTRVALDVVLVEAQLDDRYRSWILARFF